MQGQDKESGLEESAWAVTYSAASLSPRPVRLQATVPRSRVSLFNVVFCVPTSLDFGRMHPKATIPFSKVSFV